MKMSLSQATGVPFYRQIEEQIADQIRAGALQPGMSLPSVRSLAAELFVSVITTKKAYDDLEAAGLVVSHQGKGTFVATSARKASQQAVFRELKEQIEGAVRRAADLDIDKDRLREAFEASLGKHYKERRS